MSFKYDLKDHPEHEAMVPAHRAKWRERVLRTGPYSDAEKAKITEAMHKVYKDHGHNELELVLFAPSPFAMRYVGSLAWHLYEDTKMDFRKALEKAEGVVYAAMEGGKVLVDKREWFAYPGEPKKACESVSKSKAALKKHLDKAAETEHGGNLWAGWAAYCNFFREIVNAPGDWSKWMPFETLAEISGPRLTTHKFAIISERPDEIHVDEQDRPHNTEGPYIRWRDGGAMYFVNGNRVPRMLSERDYGVKEIATEQNAEVRRLLAERYGYGRYLSESDAKIVDMDALTLEGSAPRALMVVPSGEKFLVGTDGSTARVYTMPVPAEARTCREAHEMISGYPESKLVAEA